MVSAFGMLAQTEQPHGGRTVEELVTELIQPMLKTWLDDNLPGLVERLVRGSASWLLVTAMRDADHMAEQWGHDVAITRLAYMKRHLERNREAEIEPAARAKGMVAEQEDKVTLLRDTPAEPPARDLMDRYARRENIKRYKKLLREVNDDPRRQLIQKLLLEEEQKEVPFQTPSPPTARSRYLWRWRDGRP